MAVTQILDWNGKVVEVIRSKGGVLALQDFSDNLIRVSHCTWPPPEILQKLSKSEKLWAFPEADQDSVREKIGHYCDLQSVHSEDAMVWSYFGPLVYGSRTERLDFAYWLRTRLNLDCRQPSVSSVSLWRRLPHPENGSPNGPELDLLITTDTFVFAVEAKWRSGEGRWQGIDGTATQLQLRQRYLARFGRTAFGEAFAAVLYVVLDGSQCTHVDQTEAPLFHLRWADLCEYSGHPRADEVRRYYDWKRNLIVRKFGAPPPG